MISEQHYPELVHKLFVVRAPRVFPVAFSLVKPFLREDTREKIQVLGSTQKRKNQALSQLHPGQETLTLSPSICL